MNQQRLRMVQWPSPLCQSADVDVAQAAQVTELKAGEDGWHAEGKVQIEYCVHGKCRTCGRVFEVAQRVVPIQFPTLTCPPCDSKDLLLEQKGNGFHFVVEVEYEHCQRRAVFSRLLRNLVSALSIEVSPPGGKLFGSIKVKVDPKT
ncbi:MAG: hypothetical protein C4321_10180 [Chloroflexota bacterium]